jgi:hypothetical protein
VYDISDGSWSYTYFSIEYPIFNTIEDAKEKLDKLADKLSEESGDSEAAEDDTDSEDAENDTEETSRNESDIEEDESEEGFESEPENE